MFAYTNAPARSLIRCAPEGITFDFKPMLTSMPTTLHREDEITQLFANGHINQLRDFVSLLRSLGYVVVTGS